ncbi:MAG: chaperone NapD [Pseudomonadota bacterium]
MAIVGLVITAAPNQKDTLRMALQAMSGIVDVADTQDAMRLAVVFEAPSQEVNSELKVLQKWECVLAVDIAYLTYEDDIDQGGIECPPFEPRQKQNC